VTFLTETFAWWAEQVVSFAKKYIILNQKILRQNQCNEKGAICLHSFANVQFRIILM
jgi:hypothetical protein